MQDTNTNTTRIQGTGHPVLPKKRGKTPPTAQEVYMTETTHKITYNVKKNNKNEIKSIWKEFKEKNMAPKAQWVAFILHICDSQNDLEFVEDIIQTAESYSIALQEPSYSLYLHLLCDSDQIKKARDILESLQSSKVVPRIRTYTPFLEYTKRHADVDLLNYIVNQLKHYNLYSDIEIYSYILDTYTNASLPSLFMNLLREMAVSFDILTPAIYESLKTFVNKYPDYTLTDTTISPKGVCDHCSRQLEKRELKDSDRYPLCNLLEQIIRERDKHNTIFNKLMEFTKIRHFKVAIDGANVAHYKQNFIGGDFCFEQIWLAVDHLIKDLHYKESDLCIFLHEKHFSQPNAKLNEYMNKGMVYEVHRGENDDWFWMYYALFHNVYLLSNDQMRDHFFRMSFPREFRHFRENNQIYYDITFKSDHKEIKFIQPLPYSLYIQEQGDDIHIPMGIKEERDGREYIFNKWVCFQHKHIE
ncbi:hypothetical protein WA158_003395 [Blastocystis sp. Blastoise]